MEDFAQPPFKYISVATKYPEMSSSIPLKFLSTERIFYQKDIEERTCKHYNWGNAKIKKKQGFLLPFYQSRSSYFDI